MSRTAIRLIIDGIPVPQGRPRSSIQRGRIHVRDTDKSRDYKQYVSLTARQQYKGDPIQGELQATVDVYRQIPKSVSKKRRRDKNDGLIRPIVRPDLDNYIKAVFDGLDGITWNDDAQVVNLTANKYYSDNPRVEVTINEL